MGTALLSSMLVVAQAQGPGAAVDHWAVLVAGSSGYGNYRHQADVCHAYQTVVKQGIPKEHIIVMAVDDIANNDENPFPGKLFNKPTAAGTPGVDVYAGCKIDWSGRDVTPDNFVKVLTGDSSAAKDAPNSAAKDAPNSKSKDAPNSKCSHTQRAGCAREQSCCCTKPNLFWCKAAVCCSSGKTCGGRAGCVSPAPPPPAPSYKVLGSTSNSKVFINFVDHGGVGLIGFPESTMHVKELAKALQTMADKKMYKELVFYLEACESGSMFPDGTLQPNMYATTAANAKESSWGTYCSPKDKVDGKSIGSCLGDLYSVMWMQDSDAATAGETLEQQFAKVQKETTKSHVTEFGDKTVAAEPLVDFQGDQNAAAAVASVVEPERGSAAAAAEAALLLESSLDARDAEMSSAYNRFMATNSPAAAAELTRYVADRQAGEETFSSILASVGYAGLAEAPTPDAIDYECHYKLHQAYVGACGPWTTGALKHSATLAKLCHETDGRTDAITTAIVAACPK